MQPALKHRKSSPPLTRASAIRPSGAIIARSPSIQASFARMSALRMSLNGTAEVARLNQPVDRAEVADERSAM